MPSELTATAYDNHMTDDSDTSSSESDSDDSDSETGSSLAGTTLKHVLKYRCTGNEGAPDTMCHRHARHTRPHVFRPNQPYSFAIRPNKVVSTGIIHGIRAIDSDNAEVVMRFESHNQGRDTYVLFKTTHLDPGFLDDSPAWAILSETDHLRPYEIDEITEDWHTFNVQSFARNPSNAIRANKSAVTGWTLVCAFAQNTPTVSRGTPTWAVQYSVDPITCGTTFNMWNAANSAYVLSALVIGVRGIEYDCVEFAALIRHSASPTSPTQIPNIYIFLTVPLRLADMGTRATDVYNSRTDLLPKVLATSSPFHAS